jgi:hypothetical protein
MVVAMYDVASGYRFPCRCRFRIQSDAPKRGGPCIRSYLGLQLPIQIYHWVSWIDYVRMPIAHVHCTSLISSRAREDPTWKCMSFPRLTISLPCRFRVMIDPGDAPTDLKAHNRLQVLPVLQFWCFDHWSMQT